MICAVRIERKDGVYRFRFDVLKHIALNMQRIERRTFEACR